VSDQAARDILVAAAKALARTDGLGPSLSVLLDAIAPAVEAGSAAVFVVGAGPEDLTLTASYGLPETAAAPLISAVANPDHPIARRAAGPGQAYDVLPTAQGGPALRSHLTLVTRREGREVVVGVLALAHEQPIARDMRPLLEAAADLLAVAIARAR
jgi:GAF domain-containing protein